MLKTIESSASINRCDNDNKTPLFHAAAGGHTRVVTILLDAGADASLRPSLDPKLELMAWTTSDAVDIKADTNELWMSDRFRTTTINEHNGRPELLRNAGFIVSVPVAAMSTGRWRYEVEVLSVPPMTKKLSALQNYAEYTGPSRTKDGQEWRQLLDASVEERTTKREVIHRGFCAGWAQILPIGSELSDNSFHHHDAKPTPVTKSPPAPKIEKPVLTSAIKQALLEMVAHANKGVTQSDIVEIKTLKNAPGAVKLVTEAVCHMMGVRPIKVRDPSGAKTVHGRHRMTDDYWPPGKEMMRHPKFLQSLHHYDKGEPDAFEPVR
eukprot:6927989-Prymnesium_polylepis.1